MSRRNKTRAKARQLKELREENPFEDFQGSWAELQLMKLLHFIKTNLRNVLIVAGVLMVVSSVVIFIFVLLENREKESILDFEKILDAQVDTNTLKSSILAMEDIEKYENSHSGSGTKIRAALAKIKYQIEDNNFDKAAQNCLYLAEQMEVPELQAWFLIRAGFLFEKAKLYPQALKAYQDVVKVNTSIDIINVHARYGEIRMLLQSGNTTDVSKALEQMMQIQSERQEIQELQRQALALVITKTGK